MGLAFTNNASILAVLTPAGFGASFFIFQPTAAQIAAAQAQYPTAEFRQVIDGQGNVLLIHLSNVATNNNVDVNGNLCFIFGSLFLNQGELSPYAANTLNHPRLTTGGLWYASSLTGVNTTALAISKAAYLQLCQNRLATP